MKTRNLFILHFLFLSFILSAQVDDDYEVATWFGFKGAAVTYTFDDYSSSQYSVALPLFDQYDFKVTFYPVINWSPSWTELQTAYANGHEVGSHTVSHANLPDYTVAEQETELADSKSTIESKISGSSCVTIAYPNCNIGDETTISEYYIAGRICSGQVMSSSPSDFYNLSSIICGSAGSVSTADNFNTKAEAALSSEGWCVFLIHGIDDDGGYSPTDSDELSSHLSYMNTNYDDYWIGTFANVVKYIKERDDLSVAETYITDDSILVSINDGLNDTLYDAAVSLKREIPDAWEGVNLYIDGELQTVTIEEESGVSYIYFDAVPDQQIIYIANTAASGTASISLKAGWNLVGYPYDKTTDLETAFESIWDEVEIIKDLESYYQDGIDATLNTLTEVNGGEGFIIKVYNDCELIWQ